MESSFSMNHAKTRELAELYESVRNDEDYRSARMSDIFVPGDGELQNPVVVLVGEAPGKEEEKQRKPFVGPAGKNLNTLLQSIGLSRERVFITNLLKYRPTTSNGANRSPGAKERQKALPYLLKELDILAPPLVICLGLSSAKALLDEPKLRMEQANAQVFNRWGLKILVTYHPSPLNYMVPAKRIEMERAFQNLKEEYL